MTIGDLMERLKALPDYLPVVGSDGKSIDVRIGGNKSGRTLIVVGVESEPDCSSCDFIDPGNCDKEGCELLRDASKTVIRRMQDIIDDYR